MPQQRLGGVPVDQGRAGESSAFYGCGEKKKGRKNIRRRVHFYYSARRNLELRNGHVLWCSCRITIIRRRTDPFLCPKRNRYQASYQQIRLDNGHLSFLPTIPFQQSPVIFPYG